MRKGKKSYMLWMTEEEKAFIDEMAWRGKIRISEYVRRLIHGEMVKNPEVVKEIEEYGIKD